MDRNPGSAFTPRGRSGWGPLDVELSWLSRESSNSSLKSMMLPHDTSSEPESIGSAGKKHLIKVGVVNREKNEKVTSIFHISNIKILKIE